MKRFVLLLTLMAFIIPPSLSQVYEGRIDDEHPYHRVQVVFEEPNYVLEMVYEYDDVAIHRMLSFGNYLNLEDTIVLCDRLNGCDWILHRYACDSLIVRKGFSATASLMLVRHQNDCSSAIRIFPTNCNFKHNREEYKNQTDLRDLQFGLYEFTHPGAIGLHLLEDGTYNYIVDDIILSEGTWNREGNLLEFNDFCVCKAFAALVEDGFIIPEGFPGIPKVNGDMHFRVIPKEEYGEGFPIFTSKEFEKHLDSLRK